MSLPSLIDVVTVVVMLLPGFVSFAIFKWIAIIERKFSEFEMIVCSLLISLLIYTVFSGITGINNIDNIRDSIFYPGNLTLILVLSLFFGLVPSLVTRYIFRQRVVRGDCWDVCLSRAANSKYPWVIVFTEKGEEYSGRLHLYGVEGEHERELVIDEPMLIVRDKNGKVRYEIEMGKKILFLEDDVRRVVFFEGPSPEK